MGELIVILIIALIFLGPAKLPEVATSLGKAIRQFRKATQDLSEQFQIDDEVKAPLRELQAALRNDPEPYVVMPPQSKVARGSLDQVGQAGQRAEAAAAAPTTTTSAEEPAVVAKVSAEATAADAAPAPAAPTSKV